MPTTAGSSSAPARMAVWLVFPPLSLANARTVRGPKSTVSDGIRSFASTTTGSVTFSNGSVGWPSRAASTWRSRSMNSVARRRASAAPLSPNRCPASSSRLTKSRTTRLTAYSAE